MNSPFLMPVVVPSVLATCAAFVNQLFTTVFVADDDDFVDGMGAYTAHDAKRYRRHADAVKKEQESTLHEE